MQRAIIFGATGGIGQAICADLARTGWSLYLHCSHNWSAARDLSQRFSEQYPQQDFIPVKLDFLAQDNDLAAFTAGLLPVNAAIFAQGITDYNFVNNEDMGKIAEIMQVDLVTPIKLTSLLEPQLVKNDFSRIVYLGSVYGANGSAMEAVYSSAKAGLSRFSQSYAREVASTNLTVNVIAPGAVNTAMNLLFAAETMEEVRGEIPAGRLAEGSDVAYWVTTLLDRRSAYLTGQTIYVTGGWLK